MKGLYGLAVIVILIFITCFALIAKAAPTVCQIGTGCTGTSTAPSYGKILIGGKSGEYEYVASSTLGGAANAVSSVFGRTGAVTAQSGDYTTSLITEGSNLYWTQARFDNALTATTSLPKITTLSGLLLPYSQVTGTPDLSAYFTLAAWYATTTDQLRQGSNNLYFTNALARSAISLTTSGSSGAATYNSGTGVLNVPQYAGTTYTGSFPIVVSGSAISFGGLSTTTNLTPGRLVMSSGAGSISDVATSTLTPSSPLTGSFTQIGSSGSVGIQAASGSQNGYLAANDYGLLHAATTTFSAPLVYTGSTNAVTCTNASNGVTGCMSAPDWALLHTATTTFSAPLSYTASTNAVTCATCNTSNATVSSIATTWPILGGTITTTGTLSWGGLATTSQPASSNLLVSNGGAGIYGVATTAVACSGFISCTGFNAFGAASTISTTGQLGVASGGTAAASFGQGWIYSDGGTNALAASTSPTVKYIVATSTAIASQFPYASTTALSAATLCLTGDVCRTTWPTSGSGVWPFTTGLSTYGTSTQATTTPLWLQGNLYSLFASSTAVLTNASTTQLSVSGNSYLSTILSGTWNGTAIGAQYGGTGIDSSAQTGIAVIASGVWSASSTLAVIRGGTGAATLSSGDIVLGNGTGALQSTSTLAVNKGGTGAATFTSGSLLVGNGTGAFTSTSTLAVNKGGTGATTVTGLLQGNGTGAFTAITDSSTVGQVLRVTGASAYAWGALNLGTAAAITGTLPIGNGGTNASSIGSHMLLAYDGTSVLATSTPTMAAFYATSSSATSTITGNLLIDQVGGSQLFPTSPLGIVGTSSASLQLVFQNKASSATSSTDFILKNDKSTNTSYYGDLGLNDSVNIDIAYTGFAANDLYLYDNDAGLNLAAPTTTASGVIRLFTHGTLATNEAMRITNASNVLMGTTTATWGLLTVGTSTKPQLALSDNAATANMWTMRSAGGALFLATSTPTATSSVSALYLDTNGFLYNPVAKAASGNNCLQIDTTGKLSNTGSSCGGGSTVWPFTPSTYAGVANQSTTTPLWLKDTQIIASTTLFTNASTTGLTVTGNTWFPGSGIWNSNGAVGIGTANPTNYSSASLLTVAGPGFILMAASTTDVTTNTVAAVDVAADTTDLELLSHGSIHSANRYGLSLGGWAEITDFNNYGTSNGMVIGTKGAAPLVFGTNNAERMRFLSWGAITMGTTTSQLGSLTVGTSTAPQFVFSDNSSSNNLFFQRWTGSTFYMGTSTPTATSTPAALTFDMSQPGGSLSVGSSTPTFPAANGLVTIGGNGATGSSTISMGKMQWDGLNNTGARTCIFVVGTTLTVKAGACTQ